MNNEQEWKYYFSDCGVSEDISGAYLSFVRKCIQAGVPPVFESTHLSQLVGIEEHSIFSMAHAPHSFYRTFRIKKRSGGLREISTPYPSLRTVQNWIKSEVLDQVSIHNTAVGFRKNRDILYNANVHCRRKSLLKIDIKELLNSTKQI